MGLFQSREYVHYYNVSKREHCYTTDPTHFHNYVNNTNNTDNTNNQKDSNTEPEGNKDDLNYRCAYMVDDVTKLCNWDSSRDLVVCFSMLGGILTVPPYVLNGTDKYYRPIVELKYTDFDKDMRYDNSDMVKTIILVKRGNDETEVYRDSDFKFVLRQVCVFNFNLSKLEYYVFSATAHNSESALDVAKRLQPLDTVLKTGNWNNSEQNNYPILQLVVNFFDGNGVDYTLFDMNTLMEVDKKTLTSLKNRMELDTLFLDDDFSKNFYSTISLKSENDEDFFKSKTLLSLFDTISVNLLNNRKRRRQVRTNNDNNSNKKSNNDKEQNRDVDGNNYSDSNRTYKCNSFNHLSSQYDYTYSFI
jgi:hypothetical protein